MFLDFPSLRLLALISLSASLLCLFLLPDVAVLTPFYLSLAYGFVPIPLFIGAFLVPVG